MRDHDHLTGKFRGAAHSNCNLNLKQSFKIPIFFHNLRGYDGHLIARATEHFPNKKIHIIGQAYEEYLVIGFGPHMIFKDSYQFMAYSLEQLCKELANSGAERFVHLKKQFPSLQQDQLQLLLRKGVYPYEFMNDWDKLALPNLTSRAEFFNSIKQEECSEGDYAHAQKMWNLFECRTMQDYMNLYLKTDVLILADVFENFRRFSLEHSDSIRPIM